MIQCLRETLRETLSRSSKNHDRNKSVISNDAKNAIPNFDPSDSHQSVEIWLQKIEDLKSLYGWNDVTVSTFMTARLQGLARKWYDGLPSVALKWHEWKEKLTLAFADRIELPDRLTKMLARTKSYDEDMAQYYFDKLALVSACGLKGKEAVQCIIHGIKDYSIQAAVRVTNLQSAEELRAFLAKYDSGPKEGFNHRRNNNFRHHRQKPYDRRNQAKGNDKASESSTSNRDGNDKQRLKREERCYKCKEKGHFARDCDSNVGRTILNITSSS